MRQSLTARRPPVSLLPVLKHRLTLGPLLIAALVFIVWIDESVRAHWGIAGLVLGIAVLALGLGAAKELSTIFRARGIKISSHVTALAITLGLGVTSLTPGDLSGVSGVALVASISVLVLFGTMVFYTRGQTTEGVVGSVSATLLAYVYIGLMGGFFIVLSRDHSGWVLLGVLLITKSCDIAAFFTGTYLGKHKLIPWLSPKKTWEGLVGGIAMAALVGAGLTLLLQYESSGLELSIAVGALLGVIFGLVGQTGDLIASLLKRDAGVKDYAQTIPGFGGVMDVADSPLLVAPVAYWLLLVLDSSAISPTGGVMP